MAPITFSQVNAIGDILDSGRHKLEFPTIQGINGEQLTLHHADVNLPKRGVAQIGVKFLGNTANFRGSSENDNTITVTFYESSSGIVHKSIFDWIKLVRNSRDGTGLLKSQYSQPAKVHVYNTKGEPALTFDIFNMWPMSIDLPQLTEQSGPMKVQVTFSIDAISLAGQEDYSAPENYSIPQTASTRSGFARNGVNTGGSGGGLGGLLNGLNIGGLNIGSILNGGQVNLGGLMNGGLNVTAALNSQGVNIGAGMNVGPFKLATNANIPLPVNAFSMAKFTQAFGKLF